MSLKDIETKIGSLWHKHLNLPFGQVWDVGSWKMLYSLPSHFIIGFLCSLVVFAFGIADFRAFIIGAMAASLLECKDIYKFIFNENHTMYFQAVWDISIYASGASMILLFM